MSQHKSISQSNEKNDNPVDLVNKLFREYITQGVENLWSWEITRWYEFVFCILLTLGEPEILAGSIRNLTTTLAEFGLLRINLLADLNKMEGQAKKGDSLYVTIITLMQNAGFSKKQSGIGIQAICETASFLRDKYEGKVQIYLQKYGEMMLNQTVKDFGISTFEEAPRAVAIWLQNILNMPIPASNPLADKACERLGVNYEKLVEASIQQDINVALLDDALRYYWETEIDK